MVGWGGGRPAVRDRDSFPLPSGVAKGFVRGEETWLYGVL